MLYLLSLLIAATVTILMTFIKSLCIYSATIFVKKTLDAYILYSRGRTERRRGHLAERLLIGQTDI